MRVLFVTQALLDMSIDAVQAQIAIESRLKEQWPLLWLSAEKVTLVYENLGGEEPQLPYLKIYIREAGSEEKGYNGNKILYRRFGTIIGQCFVALGATATLPRQIGDTFRKVFEGRQFGGVTCREGDLITVGATSEGKYQVNSRVYYDFDEERQVY